MIRRFAIITWFLLAAVRNSDDPYPYDSYSTGTHDPTCNPKNLSPQDYTLKRCIVTRDYVSVLQAKSASQSATSPDYIVKILDKRKLLQKHGRVQRAEYEALSLSKVVNHDHCVRFHHTMQDQYYGYLVTEFLDAVTLDHYYERVKMSEEQIQFVVGELVLAVEAVHDINFIHRDVKPDNIMLTRQGHLKLIDFGFAVPWGEHESVVRSGTPFYAACEYLEHKAYNQSLDWFAVGMCTLQVVNRMGLIKRLEAAEMTAAKSKNDLPNIIQASEERYQDCVDFLKLILGDCANRPCDAAALKKHAWLANSQYGLAHPSPLDMTTVFPQQQTPNARSAALERELMQDFPMFHYEASSFKGMRSAGKPIKITNVVELRYY